MTGIDRTSWERSFARSVGRRHLQAEHRRRLRRQRELLAIPAAIGAVILLVWIAQPLPVDEFVWGIVGIVLILPLVASWHIDLRRDR